MKKFRRSLAMLLMICMTACGTAEHRAARDEYNTGVVALAKPDYDAAEKAFLAARDQAGVDPDLRFRAAFNLGNSYAAHAAQVQHAQSPDLNKALEYLGQSAAWYGDALRLRKDDPDAKANLAVVLARTQELTDELNKGENTLEKRLDHVIDDQRGLRDRLSAVSRELVTAGASAAPLARQQELTGFANDERGILTDAGVIVDLSSDEIDAIGKKPEDQRKPEEKQRLVQLQNLDLYLQDARTALSDARRKLQGLDAQPGFERGEAALVSLKRAREQLLDPVQVMRGIALDQVEVAQQGQLLAEATGEVKHLGEGAAPTPLDIPAWLNGALLSTQQSTLRDRVEEVRARLQAGLDAQAKKAADGAGAGTGSATGLVPATPGTPTPSAAVDPKQAEADAQEQRVMALVTKAMPFVAAASEAMSKAKTSYADQKISDGIKADRDALLALSRAMEQFADLRHTIDLAWAEQHNLLNILNSSSEKSPATKGKKATADSELAAMSPTERAQKVADGLMQNVDRVSRLEALLGDELKKLDEEAAKAAAAPQQPGAPAPDPEAAKAKQDQAKQQLAHAEELRTQILADLISTQGALAAHGKDPITPATAAATKLDELRRLFFSIIEHLQELIRDQGDTRDQTTTAQAAEDTDRAPLLPGLVTRQDGHATMGQAIGDALAHQADEAAKGGQAGGQGASQAAEQAKNMTAAVEEVHQAVTEMQSAKGTLTQTRDAAAGVSVDMQPALDSQGKAIEHLNNALRLLQPPPKKNDKDDKKDQKQDQQKQDQQKQDQSQSGDKSKDEQKKQAEAQKAKDDKDKDQSGEMQRVRDDEAKRQRDRKEKERQRTQPEPVDKDW